MTLLSYSPSHCDAELLRKLTVGKTRERLVDTLVEAVHAEVGGRVHQHQLLIGPRGSGKTHVLALVAERLATDPRLCSRVLPVPLPEELIVGRPAEFFANILSRLQERLVSAEPSEIEGRPGALDACRQALHALGAESDDDQALVLAAEALEEIAKGLNRLLVPMIENLDNILYSGPGQPRKSATDSQWALRKALMESPGLMLVASAPSIFGAVTLESAPFYKFFRTHTLGELPPEDMLALVRRRIEVELASGTLDRASERRLQTLNADFDRRAPRLRGLLVMTGGLPRFAHLIFDLVAETDVVSVVGMLSRFLDAQTPYFQARLDPRVMPHAELEILDALATADKPLPPTELAASLRGLSVNAVATYLKRLQGRGLVRQRGSKRKEVRYDLTEPLFRVWRRFRIGRSERERIVSLAEFVAALFEPVELLAERGNLAGNTTADFRLRVLDRAIELSRKRGRPPEMPASANGQDVGTDLLVKEARQEYDSGSLGRAFTKYGEAVRSMRAAGDAGVLAQHLWSFSHMALMAGDLEIAMTSAEEGERVSSQIGDDLGRAKSIQCRGEVLFRLGQNENALEAYEQAEGLFQASRSELGRADCMVCRGEVLLRLGEGTKALELCEEAEKICQAAGATREQADCIRSLGRVYSLLDRREEALAAYGEAESLFAEAEDDLGRASCISSRGLVLAQAGRPQEALAACEEAEKLFAAAGAVLGRAYSVFGRGMVLFQLGQAEQAFEAFERAENLYQKVGDDFGRATCVAGRGRLMRAQGKQREALELLRTAFSLALKVGARSLMRSLASEFFRDLEVAIRESPSDQAGILQPVQSLIRLAGERDEIRSGLVKFSIGMLFRRDPEDFLGLLPKLELALPASCPTLLQPARLAAEVMTGKHTRELPGEPEEVRRTVEEVLNKVLDENARRTRTIIRHYPWEKRNDHDRRQLRSDHRPL